MPEPGEIAIDEKARKIKVNGKTFTHKDTLSIDGSTGQVMVGRDRNEAPRAVGRFRQGHEMGRQVSPTGRADQCGHARQTRHELVNLAPKGSAYVEPSTCSSTKTRIIAMREMIVAETQADREKALKKLLPFQRKDFEGIFTAMKGLPVTIRLLDPPLARIPAARRQIAGRTGQDRSASRPPNSSHALNSCTRRIRCWDTEAVA